MVSENGVLVEKGGEVVDVVQNGDVNVNVTEKRIKGPKAKVELVPWDPRSKEHRAIFIVQRKECGWNFEDEVIDKWAKLQGIGELSIQWIVLSPTDPSTPENLALHLSPYSPPPLPLTDTALTFGGSPRSPSFTQPFHPVGHITLGPISSSYEHLGLLRSDGAFWISTFYVSRALQGKGIGSAAMDMAEAMAGNEPLSAKWLALNCIDKVDEEWEEKYRCMEIEFPAFSNQEWYERRGYQIYGRMPNFFDAVDPKGKKWYWNATFLKRKVE